MSHRIRARRKLLVESLEVRSLLASDLGFDLGDARDFDIFMRVDGIAGESLDVDHKGWIEIESFRWGQSNGRTLSRATGPSVAEDFHFLAPISVASPSLFSSFATGKHIAKAELAVRKSGGGQQDYYKVTLEDILVSSFQSRSIDSEIPEEELTLRFAKITESVAPRDDNGTLGKPVETSWTVSRSAARPVGESLLLHDEPDQPGAVDMFLEIDGVPGESADEGHKGAIEILSFSWGASQTVSGSGGGAGKVGALSMQDFHFVTDVNSASPDLVAAITGGKHFASASLKVRKGGGERADYLTYKLSDVIVSSYRQQSVDGTTPLDEFTLNFTKVVQKYQSDDPNLDQAPSPASGEWSNALRRAGYKLGDNALDLTSPPERSAAAYIKLDGVDGESTNSDHKGEVDVLGFSWGMSRPISSRTAQGVAASSQLKLEDFHAVSNTNKASPALFDAIAKGKHIAKAVLTVRKSGEGQGDYIKFDLSDALVTSFRQRALDDTAPAEEFSLNFAGVKFTQNSSEQQDPKLEKVAKVDRGSGRSAAGFDVGPSILEKTKNTTKRGGIHIKFDGIDGESNDKDHKGEIELRRFQWGVRRTDVTSTSARARTSPQLAFDELKFHANLDSSAPTLFSMTTLGKLIPNAALSVQTPSGEAATRDYIKIQLKEVFVTSFRASSTNNGDPIESLSLNFASMVQSYTPTDEKGVPTTPIETAWALRRGGAVPFEHKLKLEAPTSSSKGTPMYLKLSGIEGTSSSDDHQGEFEILSWSFGASNPMTSRRFGSGGGAGKVTMEEFRFVDATNSASPELAAALIAGKRIPTAVLSVTKPADGGRQDYLKVTLSDILISSYQVQGAEDESPKEEVSFDYSRIFFNIVRDDKTVVSSSFNNGAARSRFIPGESLLDVTIPPPSSDGTIHIQLEGVKGESTNQDHKGELRVESFRWGMSIPSSSRSSGGGGGAGKVSFSDLHLSLNTSSASPALLDYLATGKHIPTAVITYTESGQDGGVYDALTIKLSDILVSSYRTRGDTSNGVVNDVALKFRTGEFTVVDDVFAGL